MKQLLFVFVLFVGLSNVKGQNSPAEKMRSYEIFLRRNLIHEELLTSPVPSKYRSCKIVVTDSIYRNIPGVAKSSVIETINVQFNVKGFPIQLRYSFKSNQGSDNSVLNYFYTDTTTFIRDVHTGQTSCYLFRLSRDRHYFCETNWSAVGIQDTVSAVPTKRIWWILSKSDFDSLTVSEYRGRLTSRVILTSFSTIDSTYKCDYTRINYPFDTIRSKPTSSDSHHKYVFNSAHRMVRYEATNDYGSTIEDFYLYSKNGRLLEERYKSTSASEIYYENFIISRDIDDFIKTIDYRTNYYNVHYSFQWQ